GSLEGSISWIGNDIIFIDRQPVYRVRLTLAADSLTLPNGSAGAIRKGMTLTVHLVLTGRTLMQLLFDKTEDWLNPNIWH
ncbi:MAG: secretion protein HlyD, partial [Bacteroidota bacterium]